MAIVETFTVIGTRNGSPVKISWVLGRLSGDPPTVDLIEVEAAVQGELHGDPLASRAIAARLDPLSDPVHACQLVCSVIDRVDEVIPLELARRAGISPRRSS